MSISGISSSTSVYQNQFQQTTKDFTSLQTDLSSGDLAGAQQAYTALTQDLQNINQTQSGQQSGGNNQIGNDLAAVGSALQSGDLTGAQSAFATLTQDLQSAAQGGQQTYRGHGHHHHRHEGSSQSAGTTFGSDLAALGSALQSGNLTGAQSAFATLMQDLGNGGAQNTSTTSGAATGTQAGGSTFNIIV